ncbi:RNA polymerase sigma24 factor [Actinocatenispora thailandica]|uniref:RNA polymerase sigma24 factor n=1 Tax=Actinocatenispora thailandica TaxID=227318 RepID=A0A7R7HX16_9ACTN|nr:SigE family RNA polymerase sigma factor [Actinocatenispora thailandica]BCJ35707.1 RNA polymerase sigma24 factor [Actinocatenispora thailandica]
MTSTGPDAATSFTEFARSRLDRFRRTAFLLCGSWHTADDLTAIVLAKLYRRWRRVEHLADLDAYARRMLLRAWLDERRRPWRREHATATPPERPADAGSGPEGTHDRMAVVALLAELPPRRRAVLVLRYFNDLSVEQTAVAMGCSTGTVKSQTARALETLRGRLGSGIAFAREY